MECHTPPRPWRWPSTLGQVRQGRNTVRWERNATQDHARPPPAGDGQAVVRQRHSSTTRTPLLIPLEPKKVETLDTATVARIRIAEWEKRKPVLGRKQKKGSRGLWEFCGLIFE